MTRKEFDKLAKFGNGKTCRRARKQEGFNCSALSKKWRKEVRHEYLRGFSKRAKNIVVDKEFRVSSIESGAFRECRAESIIIADGIQMYGGHRSPLYLGRDRDFPAPTEIFAGCARLKTVRLSTVEFNLTYDGTDAHFKLGEGTFRDCVSLEEIFIPPCVDEIGASAFEGCKNLKTVTIPTVKKIDKRAFWGCKSLSQLKVRADCQIEPHALPKKCQVERFSISDERDMRDFKAVCYSNRPKRGDFDLKIEKIDGKNVLTAVGDKISEFVEIPASVQVIGERAFADCWQVENVTVPSSVEIIGEEAFANCENLRVITLNDGLKTVGKRAFYYCKKLPDIQFPFTVQSIDDKALYGCSALSSVELAEGLVSLGSEVFEYAVIEEIALPSTLASIHTYAFAGCRKLKRIRISRKVYDKHRWLLPKDVQYDVYDTPSQPQQPSKPIQSAAPQPTPSTTVTPPVKNYDFDFKIVRGVLHEVGDKVDEHAVIPDGVTSIADEACRGNSKLVSVVIPNSVKKIGIYAFAKCKNLKEVTLPDKLTVIPKGAFEECTALTTVHYPSALKTVGEHAFYNCHSLEDTELPDTLIRIGSRAFYHVRASAVFIPATCKYFGAYAIVGSSKIIGGVNVAAEKKRKIEEKHRQEEELRKRQQEAYFTKLVQEQDERWNQYQLRLQKEQEERRRQKEESERRAREEAERKAREEKERKEREERERKAREEAARKAREAEAARAAAAKPTTSTAKPSATSSTSTAKPTSTTTTKSYDIERIVRDYDLKHVPFDEKYFWNHWQWALKGEAHSKPSWARLGDFFYNGFYFKQNYLYAVLCYKKAGSCDAEQYAHMAECYHYGKGVARDLEQAFKYYNYAYNRGYDNGTMNMSDEEYDRMMEKSYRRSRMTYDTSKTASRVSIASLKREINKILDVMPSLAPPKLFRGETKTYDDYAREVKSEIKWKYTGKGIIFDFDVKLSSLVHRYPEHLSYVPRVTLTITALLDDDFKSLGSVSRSNWDNVDDVIKELGLQYAVNNYESDSKVKWIDGRWVEIGYIRSLRSDALQADSASQMGSAYRSFKFTAGEIASKTWDKFISEYDIVDDKQNPVHGFSVVFKHRYK